MVLTLILDNRTSSIYDDEEAGPGDDVVATALRAIEVRAFEAMKVGREAPWIIAWKTSCRA